MQDMIGSIVVVCGKKSGHQPQRFLVMRFGRGLGFGMRQADIPMVAICLHDNLVFMVVVIMVGEPQG